MVFDERLNNMKPSTLSIKKGIYYLQLASLYRCVEAHFKVGFIFHEGRLIESNITKAIQYYKEGSCLNDEFAKNNLGIIYKNGFRDEIKPNTALAIEFFSEAISKKKRFIIKIQFGSYLFL